jgi:DNA-directed RNA polymerases I, II, and III subunit RPABC2
MYEYSESCSDSTFGSESDTVSKGSSKQPSKIKKIRSKDDLDIQNVNPKPSVKKAISCPSDISNVSLKKVKKAKDVKKEEERGEKKITRSNDHKIKRSPSKLEVVEVESISKENGRTAPISRKNTSQNPFGILPSGQTDKKIRRSVSVPDKHLNKSTSNTFESTIICDARTTKKIDNDVPLYGIQKPVYEIPVIVDVSNRLTTPHATQYEYSELLAVRALFLQYTDPLVAITDDNYDPLVIAKKELDNGLVSLLVRRTLPNGSFEDWHTNEMIFPKTDMNW